MLVRQQAFIWTNDGQIWLCIYASLGISELKSWTYCLKNISLFAEVSMWIYKADYRFAPSQWETALLCNDFSHWLGANLESVLDILLFIMTLFLRKKNPHNTIVLMWRWNFGYIRGLLAVGCWLWDMGIFRGHISFTSVICPGLPWEKISITYTTSVLRNDRKSKWQDKG